jgi:glycosyltransferase involved in cell wall biosynthesis
MKVGIFVSCAKYPKELFSSVSGHVQVAVSSANILKKNGYEVTFITNKAPLGYTVPPDIAEGIEIKCIGEVSDKYPEQDYNIFNYKLYLFVKQLRKLIIVSGFDVIHFFGANKTAYLLGLLKLIKVPGATLMTFHNYYNPVKNIDLLFKKLLKNIDILITLTNYTRTKIFQSVLENIMNKNNIAVTPPGIKSTKSIKSRKNSFLEALIPYVLFWRDANKESGADLCVEAFEQLSMEYPHINFVFAVRKGNEYNNVLKNSRIFRNIKLLVYPYENNITIQDLISSSKAIVLPFRKLSINPQLAILETMYSGVPIITTAIESNKEIIKHRKTGMVISPSVDKIIQAVRELLNNPSFAGELGVNALNQVREEWNWEKYESRLLNIYREIFNK